MKRGKLPFESLARSFMIYTGLCVSVFYLLIFETSIVLLERVPVSDMELTHLGGGE